MFKFTNWQTKKLGEVCELISRGISPKYTEDKGVCVLNQKCIRNHEINFEPSRRHNITVKKVNEEKFIRKGDVLINSTGTGTLGRVAQVREVLTEDVTVDSHVTIVRPKKGLFHNDFFGWMLVYIEEEIALSGEGTSGQTELPRTVLANNFSVTFPTDITEQQRIVSILDEAFANIEKMKENAKKNLENARGIFDSYLHSIFTNTEDKWMEKMLGEIAQVEYGFTDNAKPIGTLRYIRITDIDRDGNLEKNNKMFVEYSKEAEKFFLREGDLLMARTGATFGKVLLYTEIERSIFASYLIRIKFDEQIENKFYWYFSKSKFYWDQAIQFASGSAQPQFNGGALKQIIFRYPKEISAQRSIIRQLDCLLKETKQLESLYQQKLSALKELKKSLLQKAFSGEL